MRKIVKSKEDEWNEGEGLPHGFLEMVKMDRRIVNTWPKWMQNIVITAQTVSTGKFLKRK